MIWKYLKQNGQPFIGLLLILVIGAIISPATPGGANVFLSPGNLTDVILQNSEIGIIALAMTFVIIGAGIDLSVGSILSVSGCIAASMMMVWSPNSSSFLAIVLALVAGAAIGLVNGLIITGIRLQPFVMTLATMIGVRGFTKWMTGNANVDLGFNSDGAHTPSGDFAELFSSKGFAITLWIVLAIVAHLILTRTVYGRYLRAIGENERAAAYTGLPVKGVRIASYVGAGLFAALAGLIHCARSHQGNPNDGVGYELDVIAAVVIGGTALAGGRGSIIGTVTGTLVLGLLTNVLLLHKVDSNVELMIKAVIIVVAVWLQRRSTGAHGEL